MTLTEEEFHHLVYAFGRQFLETFKSVVVSILVSPIAGRGKQVECSDGVLNDLSV